ncbi:nucleoside/nucleotide kinase family protein [Demequina aurantiaca]|uniref:nucleoside/nucleotide kinase family protein n=1 Tax=Demequina aurantiaca TaxID=676200 RepID=UPI003D34AA1E
MPETSSDRVVEMTLAELEARARDFLSRPGRTMLGITGPPGAGKSTLTQALVAALGADVVVVPMDGFHLSNELLEEMGRRDRKGALDTFDVAGYVALLRRIRDREEDVYAPRFDRDLEESIGSAQRVPATTPLVVTEGNYLLSTEGGWAEVRDALDEVWYVDLDAHEIEIRLVARRVGHGDSPAAARDWVANVDLPNGVGVARLRERADLIVQLREAPAGEASAPDRQDHKETS